MVRQRHNAGTHGCVSPAFRNGEARIAQNKSGEDLSATRSKGSSHSRRAGKTQRQNHFRIQRLSVGLSECKTNNLVARHCSLPEAWFFCTTIQNTRHWSQRLRQISAPGCSRCIPRKLVCF